MSLSHFSNQRCELKKINGLFIFAPVFTYDVNNSKIWVQFFYLYGLARKCHFCILTMLNQLISGLKNISHFSGQKYFKNYFRIFFVKNGYAKIFFSDPKSAVLT